MNISGVNFNKNLLEPLLNNGGGDIEFAESKEATPEYDISTTPGADSEYQSGQHDALEQNMLPNTNEGFLNNNTQGILSNNLKTALHSMLYIVMFISAVIGEITLIYDDYKEHYAHHHDSKDKNSPTNSHPEPPIPPPISRFDTLTQCAIQLSGYEAIFPPKRTNTTSSTMIMTPQWRALLWFFDGPGRIIDAPENKQCSSSSLHPFVQLYGLLVLRESLNIQDPTWRNDDTSTVIDSISDVCHHWHHLDCDEKSMNIIKLHLSTMSPSLSGSIPSEIKALYALQRLELYKNPRLTGQLPDELSILPDLQIFYVHNTSIYGTIPSSFGALTNLEELFLEHTDIDGTVPKELCELRVSKNDEKRKEDSNSGSLTTLHADCAGENPKLQCESPACCTNCYVH